ncbi:MAG: GMP synthase [Flavobacteriia bacterium]|nr:GMP synthase [Flavobacteriia bacterium]
MQKILIIDCGSSKIPSLESVVFEFADYHTSPFFDVHPSQLSEYHGVIISGAPILITEENMLPYLEHVGWIKTTDLPILGICFGHQLIGLLYNASASRMKESRSLNEIEQFVECPILNRLPQVFEMQEDHCESISIPDEFELVANSDECVNEVMQHQEKSIYGVQFHPEVSGNAGAILIENFISLCDSNLRSPN